MDIESDEWNRLNISYHFSKYNNRDIKEYQLYNFIF